MNEIDAERHRFAATLERVVPDARTNAGAWTAHEVVAHVLSVDRGIGLPALSSGARSSHAASGSTTCRGACPGSRAAFASTKARGYEWAAPAQRHRARRRDHPTDLTEVIAWLRRYQRAADDEVPDGPPQHVAYRLAGRGGGRAV